MNILEIPFIKKVGIQRKNEGYLTLLFNDSLHNHIKTIHASAQFALAETSSGELLQTQFPELVGKVIPLLRESQVKFKKPAIKSITAHSTITAETLEKFSLQYGKKGRATLPVYVEIKDSDNTVTFTGVFTWFIQRIEQ